MPILLLFIGGLLLVSAIAGTTSQLGAQLRIDFTGSRSFLYWLAALVIIGMLGYVQALKGFSRGFIVLIILAMVLRNGTGVFSRLQAAIAAPPAPATGTQPSATPSGAPSGSQPGAQGASAAPGASGNTGGTQQTASNNATSSDISTGLQVASLALAFV